jgi:hypothetical protein
MTGVSAAGGFAPAATNAPPVAAINATAEAAAIARFISAP